MSRSPSVAGIATAILLLTALPARAADWKFGLENYFAFQLRSPATSAINPNNVILHIPDDALDADLRPEVKFAGEKLSLVVRPRLQLDASTWTEEAPSTHKNNSEGRFNLTDAYVEIPFGETTRMKAGLEVFQWGPAELYNVSNPLFHLSTIGRSAFFKEKGQVLARFIFDASPDLNTMLIVNPISDNEPEWQAEGHFNPGGFLKTELRAPDGASSFGALAGAQPDGRRFFGEYGTYAFANGFSLYLDARHPLGTRRYLPQTALGGNVETLQTSDQPSTLALAGVRWEGRVDLRFEYFYNSDGLTSSEFSSSLDSLRTLSPYLPLNLARFLQPGLEIYGQHYVYASLRIPDLGRAKDASFSARVFEAAQDGSALVQASIEKPAGDAVVVLLEGSATLGADNRELTLFDRTSAFLGLRWNL